MGKLIDLVGQKFGRLEVKSFYEKRKKITIGIVNVNVEI